MQSLGYEWTIGLRVRSSTTFWYVAPRYVMAYDEGTDVDITHDVFLIHANEPKEDKVFALLKLKPLLERQNLKVLVDEEDFLGGETVFTNIARAVRRCQKSLIVLTEHSRESPWCSLELLLALEKSHRRNIMSVVVLRKGNSVEQQLKGNELKNCCLLGTLRMHKFGLITLDCCSIFFQV
uniref:Uncharacterized protein n=1 Tax=Magallana gigas TaxID=29159 RepID=K1QGG9_MAGGI